MPTETGVPPYAIAVVAASALGGLIAMANMVVGKEQKTSEARKDWIDGLRANLAAFFAHAQLLSLLWESKLQTVTTKDDEHGKLRAEDVLKFRSDHKELYGNMLAAFHDVQLRLGTNPKEFESLRSELDEIYKAFEGNTPDCHLQFKRKELSLRDKSSLAMKREWEKVRDGEKSFLIVKRFLYGLVIVLGVSVVGVVVWIHV